MERVMVKKTYALSKVYGLLGPGPVLMLTTSMRGKANIMTMSWQTPMEFVPPLVGCVISGRNYSFDVLVETKQCVLNIPSSDMAKQVVAVGNCSGSKVDKFKKFGLTAIPASKVMAPLIAECFANLECKVVDTGMVNKYNFFVLEVVKAWIDPAQKYPRTLHHRGKGVFMVGGDTIKLPSRMA
jgi:flavin reductase (DIM6/NTAB) family NADH-FMN oxidoreductase RutF